MPDTHDIVERLRAILAVPSSGAGFNVVRPELFSDAADEIERLTAERDTLNKALATAREGFNSMSAQDAAEIERLRAALTEIACYSEGPTVNSSFDEPGSAARAREALEQKA